MGLSAVNAYAEAMAGGKKRGGGQVQMGGGSVKISGSEMFKHLGAKV